MTNLCSCSSTIQLSCCVLISRFLDCEHEGFSFLVKQQRAADSKCPLRQQVNLSTVVDATQLSFIPFHMFCDNFSYSLMYYGLPTQLQELELQFQSFQQANNSVEEKILCSAVESFRLKSTTKHYSHPSRSDMCTL